MCIAGYASFVKIRLTAAIGVLVFLAGCPRNVDINPRATSTSSPSYSQSSSPSPTPTGSCPESKGGAENFTHLTDVRVATHAETDRIAFEFEVIDGARRVPKYDLKPGTPPFSEDPSGEPMTVDGNDFFTIVMFGAMGAGPEGTFYDGPKEFKRNYPVLTEAEESGDFEATLSWVFGLSRRSCPQVTELSGPIRLVLDFPH